MFKNIMLAFVSPVNPMYINNPITYQNIQGQPYTSIQTNESAIVYIERMLGKDSLSKIFLIASDSVRNKLVSAENEFGSVTHLDFLQRRVLKECPQLEGNFTILDYSDKVDEKEKFEKNILQIADIADAITEYAKTFSNAKLKVHADMTGGFRHTSMMMLSIMQLLKYRGIEIGEVLYSDQNGPIVYQATEIQRMFTLITGADEFVKFGSVEALQEYFGSNPPKSLKELLTAMKTFSEAIKICRTNTIESELKNLGRHINTFRNNQNRDLKSELFAKIIDTIEVEYGNLIKDNVSRLDIIRWCMKKGFWQQAMTLCTEWLPEELVDRGICKPKNQRIAYDAKIEGLPFGRGWKQQLIIAYQGQKNTEYVSNAVVNEFCGKLRHLIGNLFNPFVVAKINKPEYGDLKKFDDEYKSGLDDFEKLKKGKIKDAAFSNKYPKLYQALQTIYDDRNKMPTFNKNFTTFLKTFDYERMHIYISKLSDGELLKIFNIDKDKIPMEMKKVEVDPEKSERRWANREEMYRSMMKNDILVSNVDRETAIDLLKDYYYIRVERNQVNHANGEASKDIADLGRMIENYLNKLDRVSAH